MPSTEFSPDSLSQNSVAQLNGTTFISGVYSTLTTREAVVVESENGSDWHRMPFDGEIGGDPRIVAVPSGLLLVGWADGDPDCDTILRKVCLRMWHTSDGRSWQAMPSGQMQLFERVSINSIVSGPNGFVAVGTRVNPSYPRYDEAWTEGVAFHSFDGLTWTQARFRDGTNISDATGMRPYPVVATASGYVALHDQEDGYPPAIWLSADGLTWDRSSAAMPFECSPELVAGSSGILAYCAGVGWSNDGGSLQLQPDMPSWVSADGKTWRKAPADCPYWHNLSWVAGDGKRIVIITGDSVYWSTDATTWTRGASTPVPSGNAHEAGPLDASLFGSTIVILTRGPNEPSVLGVYLGSVADK